MTFHTDVLETTPLRRSAHDRAPLALLVTADVALRNFLADNLRVDGYAVVAAGTVADALSQAEEHFPDVIVADVKLSLPGGFDLLEAIRSADSPIARVDRLTPCALLSDVCDELTRIRALERGADVILGQPFSYPELRAQLAGLLRRAAVRNARTLDRCGPLIVDAQGGRVQLHGRPVELSRKEFALLTTLISDPTRVFTKHELLRTLWGIEHGGQTRTLDSHACRLRQKLAVDDDRFVICVWGVGYRLVDAIGATAEELPA